MKVIYVKMKVIRFYVYFDFGYLKLILIEMFLYKVLLVYC